MLIFECLFLPVAPFITVIFLIHPSLFSRSVMFTSLQPRRLQLARLPCPSPSSRACSNSCSSSQWCHPTISSSVISFFSCLQSFPVLVFSNEAALCIRWPKYWNLSFSPSSEYSGLICFRIDWLIYLQSKGLWRIFSLTTVWKHQFFSAQPSLWPKSHIHSWLLEKP